MASKAYKLVHTLYKYHENIGAACHTFINYMHWYRKVAPCPICFNTHASQMIYKYWRFIFAQVDMTFIKLPLKHSRPMIVIGGSSELHQEAMGAFQELPQVWNLYLTWFLIHSHIYNPFFGDTKTLTDTI